MAASAPIPLWATDKRTFKIVNIAIGVALCALLAIVAALAPTAAQAVANVVFVPTIIVAVAIALPIIGLRMFILRNESDQEVPTTRWLVAYVLSALPTGLATLLLGALTTVAFVFKLETAPALAVSIVALLGVWVLFSLTVKIVVNLQLLLRHWAKP